MTEIDLRALRNAFGCFPIGVTIITTREADGTRRGFTANSFTSVSLDPPLLLVSIAKSAASLPVFEAAGHFAVNIPDDGQRAVSALFGARLSLRSDGDFGPHQRIIEIRHQDIRPVAGHRA